MKCENKTVMEEGGNLPVIKHDQTLSFGQSWSCISTVEECSVKEIFIAFIEGKLLLLKSDFKE